MRPLVNARERAPIRPSRLESASAAFWTANCARWGIGSEPAERPSRALFLWNESRILDPRARYEVLMAEREATYDPRKIVLFEPTCCPASRPLTQFAPYW